MNLVEMAYFTENVKEMADFYRNLLNSDPVAESEDMAIFYSGKTKIFIHRTYTPGEGDLPPQNHIAFAVDDVDLACKEMESRGLMIEVPPNDYYWGRSAYLRDPDGQQIELTGKD